MVSPGETRYLTKVLPLIFEEPMESLGVRAKEEVLNKIIVSRKTSLMFLKYVNLYLLK